MWKKIFRLTNFERHPTYCLDFGADSYLGLSNADLLEKYLHSNFVAVTEISSISSTSMVENLRVGNFRKGCFL